jgi:A/G-specific adenine glycosylase
MKHSETKLNLKKEALEVYTTFAREVLVWHKRQGRHDLPWRKGITPYKVLVSEIMLQQTQVARVLLKYTLWMKQYPTLAMLADTTLKDVLILWQGLGYQRRAKALLFIAKTVTKLPESKEELLRLPGVGEYTASAMLSFAYNVFSFMLETNIRTALVETFHKKKTFVPERLLKNDLEILIGLPIVQKVGARVWYYALMDYGAQLKSRGISHNLRTQGYTKQTPYRGSLRKLRAEVLFAITHNRPLPHGSSLDI